MRTTEDWRSPKYGEQFKGFERPDFAHEFLRRNPKYIAEIKQARNNPKALKEVAARWGLIFHQ